MDLCLTSINRLDHICTGLGEGQHCRGRINVMGAIRESDRKRVCFFIKKGNADIFLEQLQQFNELIKQE